MKGAIVAMGKVFEVIEKTVFESDKWRQVVLPNLG